MSFITPDKPLEKEILPLFTTAVPFQLPVEWKNFIVKITPWIMLLLVPLYLLVIGLGTISSLFSAFTAHILSSLGTLCKVAGMVCSLFSIKGLFDRKREGWVWAYYAFLLFLVGDIFYLDFLDAIITFLISGYFLFQIREYYS
ncbi:hypothetical protein [Emticicia sp. 17c]|uniref:hypothetical protein n=1 Tax=Emticicia sp. 17c TaxID=3127704 RepID=UPI00301CD6C6